MSMQTDLTIPLSALKFESETQASAMAEAWNVFQVGVMLQMVIETTARGLLEEGSLETVSATFDMSASAMAGSEIQFESRIDRKTRTLIFASGIAKQNDRHLLKATVVFRID
ncbi:MAG: hypothetical protein AAFP24_06775 [Pseudomonadota bacterium]